MSHQLRTIVRKRSGGMCEAMILVNNVWTRCWDKPVEMHHLLPRSRGGRILDAVGEDYHLIDVCPKHHRESDTGEGFVGGLMISGYVVLNGDRPVYTGPDEFLKEKYGRL